MSGAFAKMRMDLARAVVCAGHVNPWAGLLRAQAGLQAARLQSGVTVPSGSPEGREASRVA